jgi:tRNA 2-thiocytidine biosynthesis protein TtcA
MPAWLRADDGVHVVIRPMIYCAERTLARYAEERRFPVLPCGLCGAQPGGQRQRVKALLAALEAEHPHLKSSIMAALANVQPSQLLDPTVVRRSGHDRE